MKTISNDEARNLLGIRVIKLRKERKLTQRELATMAGLCRGYIIDVEKGRRNITVSTLARIAWSFGMSLSALLENKESEILDL